jgi:hypothetical protein
LHHTRNAVRVVQARSEQKTQTRFIFPRTLVFAFESDVERSTQKFSGKLRIGISRTPSLEGKEPVLLVGCPRLMVEVHVGGVPVSSGNEVFDHD